MKKKKTKQLNQSGTSGSLMALLCRLAVSTLYLRPGVIVVHVAGVHVLRHDDEGQEVWGVERARSTAGASKEKEVMQRKLRALGEWAWRVCPHLE